MDATPAAAKLDWVAQVKHRVVDEVVNCVTGNIGAIKNTADHDRVVRRIVVSEAPA